MSNPFFVDDDLPNARAVEPPRTRANVDDIVNEFASAHMGERRVDAQVMSSSEEYGVSGGARAPARTDSVSGTRRREKEVSAEERINETASAVIKAGGASAGSTEAFVGSSHDAAFSDRLAVATAKIAMLAAQLKAKTETARQQREQEKQFRGGKELLRQLQDAAGSQHATRVPSLISVQSLRRGEAPEVRDGKVTKSLGYKIGAASRRTSQRLLQNFGSAEKTDDQQFKGLWSCVQEQERILQEICAVGAAYKEAQRNVFTHSKRLAELVRQLVESGDKNNTWEGAPRLAREAALREACSMVDVADALVTRCTPLNEEVFDWNIIDPTLHRRQAIPGYKACVAKRTDYKVDMDAFDRQLAAMKKKPPKNVDDLSVKEEQARLARQRFNDFNSRLTEELAIVDGLRYEMAYSLVRGFANVQCFNLERQLDIARALRGSPSN